MLPAEIISLASLGLALGLGVLNFMKFKKTKKNTNIIVNFVVAFAILFVVSLVISIKSRTAAKADPISIVTRGDNSPAAVVTGSNNEVYQANGEAKITINKGYSVEDIRAILKEKDIAAYKRFAQSYPQGYVLAGIGDGKVVAFPKLKNITVDADWDNMRFEVNEQERYFLVHFESMVVQETNSPCSRELKRMSVQLPLVENQPILNNMWEFCGNAMYFEILDLKERIFLMGFRSSEQATPPKHTP